MYPEVRDEANDGKDKAEWSPVMTNSKQDICLLQTNDKQLMNEI